MRFKDKSCLITGGGSGIGQATCLRLASEGGRIAVVDRDLPAARKTVDQITRSGGTAQAIACDVGFPDQIQNAIDQVIQAFKNIHVLVNDAAMMTFTPVVDTTAAAWDHVMQVNIRGPFLLCKHAVPHMPPHSAIVNVSSVHAHESEAGVAPYAASKGAMEAFSRVLALELEHQKIRVNCVAPGAVDTPMLWTNPNVKSGKEKIKGAVGAPQDIAAAIAFLASEEARFITGTTLVVDGGRLDIL